MENENEHVAHDVDVAEPPHDDDEDVDDVDVDDDDDVNDIRAEGVVWDDDEAADEKEDNNSDDPVAEGEEPADKLPDPSMKLHGENKFSNLCKLLEHICKRKSNKSRTFTKQAMLEKLFPPKLFEIENARLEAFFQSPGDQPPPESIFPMLRLLYPDKDGSRSLGMQEGKLADAVSVDMIVIVSFYGSAKLSHLLLFSTHVCNQPTNHSTLMHLTGTKIANNSKC